MNTSSIPHFQDMHVPELTDGDLKACFAAIDERFSQATALEDLVAAIRFWDGERRRVATWKEWVSVRFTQDTADAARKDARERMEALWPSVTDHGVQVKRMLLNHPQRAELEAFYGPEIFEKWKLDIATFDPVIADDLVEESTLSAQYTELMASAELPFRGETYNLSTILRFMQDSDRTVRHEATAVYWGWFEANRAELDRIFGALVTLRTQMAHKLGMPSHTELGYLRMQRLDYGPGDVAKFRDQVRQYVVPLAQALRGEQAERLGLDELMFWDETVFDPSGNPAPQGDHDWMVERATEMFDAMHPEMSSFFRLLHDRGLMDLKSRPGKAGGGYCTDFMEFGVPFIYANFNGTKGDVVVFTHEMGHAFQGWSSQSKPLMDQVWPTMESAEIHSMSLEFLTWPHMDKFFGADADRFRRQHLAETLLFLPYGVAVDHFQHLIYAKPDATPDERNAMWQEVEAMYLPWRKYGDIAALKRGAAWQRQLHIYGMPFYYIDYTLAATCALQFWVRSEENAEAALADYVRLCARGGDAPFRELCRSAGLRAPFEDGALAGIAAHAAKVLGISA